MKHLLLLLTGLVLIFVNALAQDNYQASTSLTEVTFERIGNFDLLRLESEDFTEEVGNPKIPFKELTYVVPFNATITGIVVNSVTKVAVTGQYTIYPAQPKIPLNGEVTDIDFVEPNNAVYYSAAPYPNKIVEIAADNYTMGYHVVTVRIYPIEYLPLQAKVNLYTNVNFTINYTTASTLKSITAVKSEVKEASNAVINYMKSVVANPKLIEEPSTVKKASSTAVTDGKDGSIPECIIITNTALKPAFLPLVAWKNKRGLPTQIITIEEIYSKFPGSSRLQKIRNYLKYAFTKWRTNYVIIGGDVAVVPAMMVASEYHPNDYFPSDLYFAAIDGEWKTFDGERSPVNGISDYGQDFFLGRIPVNTAAEAAIMINKITTYENLNVPDQRYVNNYSFWSAFLSKSTNCNQTVLSTNAKFEFNKHYTNYVPKRISAWMVSDDAACANNGKYIYNFTTTFPSACGTNTMIESFESSGTSRLPVGWVNTDNNWGIISVPSNIPVRAGTKILRFKASALGNGATSILESPYYSVIGDDSKSKAVFSFCIYIGSTASTDSVRIELIAKDNSIISKWSIKASDPDPKRTGWRSYQYSSLTNGQELKFRITGTSYAGPDIYLDAFFISQSILKNYVDQSTYCTAVNEELSETNTLSILNNGRQKGKFHILYHVDHSGTNGIGVSGYDKNNSLDKYEISGLQNAPYYQIFFSNGCNPANFAADCFGEHYVRNAAGGGVAFIGNSDVGWVGEENALSKSVVKALHIYPLPGKSITLGSVFNTMVKETPSQRFNLLGDPSLLVWTDIPSVINATITPANLTVGQNTITINIDNLPAGTEALVSFSKDGDNYMVYPITGSGNYSFTYVANLSGTLNITITAKNLLPLQKTLAVTASSKKHLYISSSTIDDDNLGDSKGNNDKIVSPGEKLELDLAVKNNTTAIISNVSATLSTLSPYFTLVRSAATYGSIAVNEQKSPATKYVVQVSPNIPIPSVSNNFTDEYDFTLNITDNAGYTNSVKYKLKLISGILESAGCTIVSTTDGDLIIEAGETVNFKFGIFNSGAVKSASLNATLTSNSPNVLITSGTSSYSEIPVQTSANNSSDFVISIPGGYITGSAINLTLTLLDANGYSQSFGFNLADFPVQIISGFNSYPDFDRIKLYWNVITNIKGYNIYRCNSDANGTQIGSYTKVNTFVLEQKNYVDYNLPSMSYYLYVVKVVGLNGNEGPSSNALHTYTTLATKAGWPVTTSLNSRKALSGIMAADVNGDNKKEIFLNIITQDNKGYMLAYNQDGSESFDLDNNTTTFSGFNYLGTSSGDINTSTCIADLNKDGKKEILGLSLTNLKALNYSDSDGNGSPDVYFNTTIDGLSWLHRNKVVSDIDNDGKLEIILTHGLVPEVYDNTGKKKTISWAAGPLTDGWGSISVADLDGDGDKEIIGTYVEGIYIWHHNGTAFVKTPFFQVANSFHHSSSVIADIDNDGAYEILFISELTIGDALCTVHAVELNGTKVSTWKETTIKKPYCNGYTLPNLTVADLDNNGRLEVVVLCTGKLLILNNLGSIIRDINNSFLDYHAANVPIIGDIDSDSDLEVVVSGKMINAYNMDGTNVHGFPVTFYDNANLSPAIDDIDGDGKNELIAASTSVVQVWETEGLYTGTGWIMERQNLWNTGVYGDFTVLPGIPTPVVEGELLTYTATSAHSYIIDFYREIGGKYKTLTMNKDNTIGFNELGLAQGELVYLIVTATNNVGKTTSEKIYVYNSECNEKTVFSATSDIDANIKMQKFSSNSSIVMSNLTLAANHTFIATAPTSILLLNGFKCSLNSSFHAYKSTCTVPTIKTEEFKQELSGLNLFSNGIEVFPNPSNGSVTISMQSLDGEKQIAIYSLTGSLIYNRHSTESELIIDLSTQPKGLYYIKVSHVQGMESKKLVLQ